MMSKEQLKEESELITLFNNRDNVAFSLVYDKVYRELFFYAHTLFNETIEDTKDIIQDIFVEIYQKRELAFLSVKDIKSYIYVVVKNRSKAHYNKSKVISRANNYIKKNEDYYSELVIESETLSLVSAANKVLPDECAKAFRLFIDGLSVKEIATLLNKKESTIYNQRREAITILKREFSKDMFILLTMIIISKTNDVSFHSEISNNQLKIKSISSDKNI